MGNWGGWPNSFSSGIDAALRGTGPYEGKAWFFKGNQYLRYDLERDQVELGSRPIAGYWRNLPATFAQGIDAAVHGMGNYYGVCWLFKGSNYVRYNLVTDMAETAAVPIRGNWGGNTWPESFANGVDFAFYGTGGSAEKFYFFRGNQYIVYDLKTDRVESGPHPIFQRWKLRGILP